MQAIRELSAVGLLVLRSWQRMGPRMRSGRAPEPTRGVSAVLMRLVFAALIYNFGMIPAHGIAARPHPAGSAAWALLGLGCYAFALGFTIEVPYPRAPTSPLKSALLEMLPVSRAASVLLLGAQAIWGLLPFLGCTLTVRSELGAPGSLFGSVALALELFAVCTLGGSCLGKLLKLWLSPYWASRSSWLSTLILIAGIVLVQVAIVAERVDPPVGLALGRAAAGQGQWAIALVLLLALVSLLALFLRLERRYELSEPVSAERTASELSERADLNTLERLLMRREPGGRAHWFAAAMHLVYAGGLAYLLARQLLAPRVVLNLAVVMCFQLVTGVGTQRAARGAMRDVLARPLLGALPLTPQTTLLSKAAAMRGALLVLASPLLVLFAACYSVPSLLPLLLWRLGALLGAVLVYAQAAVYVAFLTVGLGSTRPRAGAFGSLESMLLAIPFATVCFAPDPWTAALALATLCALTFEARRSALRVVDWLDDPEQGHATEIWRALVVFAGFQGAQLLGLQLALFFGPKLDETLRFVVVYALSAAALWFPTQREQTSPRPRQRLAFAPLGLPVGVLSGACAWAYLHVFQPDAAGAPRLSPTGGFETAVLALTVVGLAPLVEERFFRGWLQTELERGAPARRYLAPVLTGLAFALAHPSYSFLPVLVFGLLSGFLMLRTRSLAACVVAHAVHNAIALSLNAN